MAAAAEVVRRIAASGLRADQVLKNFLKEHRISGRDAARCAQAVQCWYRWQGFLSNRRPGYGAIGEALSLADRFARLPESIPAGRMMRCAVPPWLAEHLEVSPEFLSSLQTPPVIWLRARPGEAASLVDSLEGARLAERPGIPDAVLYSGRTDLFRTAAFREGKFEIQDVASQAVGLVCAPEPRSTWWDACAGEGGKTLHLGDLLENRGLIWASDRSRRRLSVLRRRAARAGVFNIRIRFWDGGDNLPTRTRFDGVLLDAPCSGVGTWRRHPHARWTTTPTDVAELAGVQRQLLARAATAVKPGGRLVYAVCTLTREETDGVADAFERGHPDFEPAPFGDPFQPEAPPAARALWWPQLTGGNGMYVAVWRRISH